MKNKKYHIKNSKIKKNIHKKQMGGRILIVSAADMKKIDKYIDKQGVTYLDKLANSMPFPLFVY